MTEGPSGDKNLNGLSLTWPGQIWLYYLCSAPGGALTSAVEFKTFSPSSSGPKALKYPHLTSFSLL